MFICKINEINYLINLNEMIDSQLFFNNYYEKITNDAINRLCKKGMIVLDIGANIGAYTFNMAKLVGNKGKVIAFEPMSFAYKKLEKNFKLNKFNNIILENLALSDKSYENFGYFKSSWLLNGKSNEYSLKKQLIRFETLDNYLTQAKINKIDFIKIDVDGYEFKVLKGAINTIKKSKPIILLETQEENLKKMGDNLNKLISFVLNFGYNLYSEETFNRFEDRNKLIKLIRNGSIKNIIVSLKNLNPTSERIS